MESVSANIVKPKKFKLFSFDFNQRTPTVTSSHFFTFSNKNIVKPNMNFTNELLKK